MPARTRQKVEGRLAKGLRKDRQYLDLRLIVFRIPAIKKLSYYTHGAAGRGPMSLCDSFILTAG
jgi:hypothetical protein